MIVPFSDASDLAKLDTGLYFFFNWYIHDYN